jgi:DNA-binding response OmpR family regulator
MPKILVAEDTTYLAEVICSWLEGERYTVETVTNGDDALEHLKRCHYDAVVLDWGLPGMAGIDVCRAVRQAGNPVPILMLTIKKNIDNKEAGFDSGADDYLTKPFEMRELSARIKALLKRPRQNQSEVLTAGNLQLDTHAHTVTKDGAPIQLDPKEFKSLEFFMRNPRHTFSLDELFQRLWSSDSDASTATIRRHINRLRSKISDDPETSMLKNVRGVGYTFEP